MKLKNFVALICAFTLTISTAHASILGSETVSSSEIEIGHGATLKTNVFYSDQAGVEYQSEYFVEYTPNTNLIPAVINGDIYGKITTSSMAANLISGGLNPAMLMNSDFFALNTGVPLSHQVVERELVVMDAEDMDAIGFNYDSTAFIAPLGLDVTASVDSYKIDIGVVNKARQPYFIYMYTDKFADTTKATGMGVNVVINPTGCSLSIGETLTGIVESVTFDNGAVAIPRGKVVLSADLKLNEDILNQMYLFTEGAKVEIDVSATGDERWKDAEYILGAWGGVILRNSEFSGTDEAAAPRTALGIKQDGSIVFYTLDGRQSGHSYGARIKTLAQRLKELGCTDAINLDGGGSTTLGAVYPGKDEFDIINSPSDGSERKVATFVGLINTKSPSQTADKLYIYPYYGNYISGYTESFAAVATDTDYYKAPLPQTAVFTAPDGTKSHDGKIQITGDGYVSITAQAGNIEGSVKVKCYTTPTFVKIKNGATSKEVTSLEFAENESVNLDAYPFVGNALLKSQDDCLIWTCSENIGTIDQNGNFTSSVKEATGTINISAGSYTRKIPVTVKPKNSGYFEDVADDYWAKDIIYQMKDKKIINGITIDGKNYFMPQNNITRGEFAVMIANVMGINPSDFANTQPPLADLGSLPDWCKNHVKALYALAVMSGKSTEKGLVFDASRTLTRAEAATVISRLVADTSEVSNTEFTDSDAIPHWAGNAFEKLAAMGIINGYTDGSVRPMNNITRSEVVKILSEV